MSALSGKMIWTSAIAVEMVDGWTQEQITELIESLDEAVEKTFEAVEAEVIDANPLVRLVIEQGENKMGMDVIGKAPRSEKGEYFRNNVWWWRPLWEYCEEVYPKCQEVSGHYNDGDGLEAPEAEELSKVLMIEIEQGRTKAYEQEREAFLNAIPDEPCDFCDGMGIVMVKPEWPDYVEGEVKFRDPCNACDGKKTKRPWVTNYPFSEENVKEFAEFLKDSGGFQIY